MGTGGPALYNFALTLGINQHGGGAPGNRCPFEE